VVLIEITETKREMILLPADSLHSLDGPLNMSLSLDRPRNMTGLERKPRGRSRRNNKKHFQCYYKEPLAISSVFAMSIICGLIS
jgi:hypothetical protein